MTALLIVVWKIIRKTLCAYGKENGMTVHIIEHETNRGLAASRNTAMKWATGDYVIHIDSDDYIEEDMLEKTVFKSDGNKCGYFIGGLLG